MVLAMLMVPLLWSPPAPEEVLPDTVVLVIVRVPLLKRPPPCRDPVLPEKVELETVPNDDHLLI